MFRSRANKQKGKKHLFLVTTKFEETFFSLQIGSRSNETKTKMDY